VTVFIVDDDASGNGGDGNGGGGGGALDWLALFFLTGLYPLRRNPM